MVHIVIPYITDNENFNIYSAISYIIFSLHLKLKLSANKNHKIVSKKAKNLSILIDTDRECVISNN